MEVFWKGQTAAQMLYSTHFMHQPAQSQTAASSTAAAQPPPATLANQYGAASAAQNSAQNHLEQVVAAAAVAAVTVPTQNLVCALCPKTFDNQILLSEHLRSHATGAKKPYTCQICDKSFLQSNNLQTHMK